MCGRFVQSSATDRLALHFRAVDTVGGPPSPRYNVAPSTPVLAIVAVPERRLGHLQWGFIPSWAVASDSGPRPINARSENAATSRLFGPALATKRCIVPLDGWYEWTDEGGARQPWFLTLGTDAAHHDGPAAVAALWSTWRDPSATSGAEGARRSTVALMTTAASGRAADVHHRMPLVVPGDLLDDWLDPGRTEAAGLLESIRQRTTPARITRVARRVNDVRNDDATLIEADDGCMSGGAGR